MKGHAIEKEDIYELITNNIAQFQHIRRMEGKIIPKYKLEVK